MKKITHACSLIILIVCFVKSPWCLCVQQSIVVFIPSFWSGYPSPHQAPYPMKQMGDSVPPYPVPYGEPGSAAPPAGFYMGYPSSPNQPVMYQPGPGGPPQQPMQVPAYGGKYQENKWIRLSEFMRGFYFHNVLEHQYTGSVMSYKATRLLYQQPAFFMHLKGVWIVKGALRLTVLLVALSQEDGSF